MNRSRKVLLVWGTTMTLAALGTLLMIVNWSGGESFVPHSLVSFGFASVGALIMLKRPHRIGTLFLAFGAFTSCIGFMFQICPAVGGGAGAAEALCGDESRIGAMLWPASYLLFGCLFLLFPTGTLPSRRWRPIAVVFLGSWSLLAVGGLVVGDRAVEEHLGFLPAVAVWALAIVALTPIFRIRKADPVERQQLRWLGYVIGLTLLLIVVGVGFDLAGHQGTLNVLTFFIFLNAVVGVPAAITVAILRYRLYDIDVIVNRTLVYVGLTVGLAAAYLGSVVILQRLLAPVTAESDIAVAGSTLAVAALFRPMRERMQSFIDHRFYRRKYNATEALQRFSTQLRDQVDLESLKRELVSTVGSTMHPAHASVLLLGREP